MEVRHAALRRRDQAGRCLFRVGIPVGGKSELPVAAVAGMATGASIGPNAGERLIPKYSGRTRERNTNAKFRHQLSFNRLL